MDDEFDSDEDEEDEDENEDVNLFRGVIFFYSCSDKSINISSLVVSSTLHCIVDVTYRKSSKEVE